MSKRSRRKAVGRVVRRTLADGTVKEYRYGAYRPTPTRVTSDSLEALIRAYKRSPAWAALAPVTKEGYARYLKPFDEIGHLKVKDVARRDLLLIRDAIANTRGIGAATGFTRAASVLFSWGVDQEWLAFSPVHKIRRLPGGTLRAWTIEQAQTALLNLPEHFRRAVILGVYTGQRRGDLCALRWSAYDGSELKFIQQKTKVEITLRLLPELKDELDAWKATATALTILTDAKGRPWLPNKLSVTLPLALQAIGLPPGLNVHGLRKMFAASLADNGATTHEIAANTGHKTLAMIQLYTRSADQKKLQAEAVAKIQRFTKHQKSGEKA